MSTEQSLDPQLIEQTKQQIRSLVGEIAQLAKSEIAPEEFHEQFLPKVVSALAAIGGAVWTINDGRLGLAYQINLQETRLQDKPEEQIRHGRLLHKALRGGEGLVIPPHSGAGEDTEAANPTDFLLVLGPIKTDIEVVGVVEVFQRPGSGPATQRGYLRFLMQMCDLAGDFFKSRKLKHYSDRQAMWTQLEEFTRRVHASLDPREAAYTIANEGRRLIECDRVSVAIKRGNRCRIEAVSGQDLFDKRSNTVRLLGELATAVVAAGEPMWYTGDTSDMAPQVEDAVQEYVDESHSKTVAVLPLFRPKPEPTDDEEEEDMRAEGNVAVGALVVEQIEDVRVPEKMLQRVDVVAHHSATALSNATDYHNLFLMPLWRTLGKTRFLVKARTLPKSSAVAGAILAAILFLVFWPANLELQGEGTLEPVKWRYVFAGVDGVVDDIWVEHGSQVYDHAVVNAQTSADKQIVMAVFGDDDPQQFGDQFRRLSVVTGNGRFKTNGVQAGDIVQVFLALDTDEASGQGETGADWPQTIQPTSQKNIRFSVGEVIDENTLRIREAAGAKLATMPHRIEIWRTTLLARLRNREINVAIEQKLGEIGVANEELERVQRGLSFRGLAADEQAQLQSQRLEAKMRLESLQKQLTLLLLKQQELLVLSPMEGPVITWDVKERLKGRPVQRGQQLMRVADPTGPWQLEIEMPEKNMGHITRAQHDIKPDLDVEYILFTDSGNKREGAVKEVHLSAEVTGEKQSSVLIKVHVEADQLRQELPELRQGAMVRAKVCCGKRAIGYVWLHDAIAYLQSRIFFRWF
jgi:hypothetical protein